MVAAVFETGLEFFREVLALRGYRQQLLSADIANASTPGFKAVDLDFAAALKAADARQPGSGGPTGVRRMWLVDDERQMTIAGAGSPGAATGFVKYQTDAAVTLDGNSVDLDHEKVSAAENGVQYEAAATFATQTIRLLMTAINGSGAQPSSGT